MLYDSRAVISPTTSVATGTFSLSRSERGARLVATNLAGAETVELYTIDGGVNTAVTDAEGAAVTLTATEPGVVIDTFGPFYVSKSATAGSSGVYLAVG